MMFKYVILAKTWSDGNAGSWGSRSTIVSGLDGSWSIASVDLLSLHTHSGFCWHGREQEGILGGQPATLAMACYQEVFGREERP